MAEHRHRPSFHGEGATLFGIFIVSLLLTMVTLGIYSFWARTKLRRYLWNSLEFEGDRLAYHGTGMELLKGWLMAAGILCLLFLILLAFAMLGDVGATLGVLAFYAIILCLVPLAIIGARRYRLSRTSWRGIRFSQHGDTFGFVKLWIGGIILTGLTLSIYHPFFEVRQRTWLWNETRLGSARFRFEARPQPLLRQYIFALLLTIPTLGLNWFWYSAFRNRYFWDHTTFENARFSSTVTGGGLLGLTVTNLLLIIFTLGIGTPWALVRQFRYHTDNLSLEGAVDFAAIAQRRGPETGTAEGLADVLDVGGFDIGF
jgi:uncharacterized membrane protein YjgN (DUF898 family)